MGKVYELKREQFLKSPKEDVFRFFSRPENLEKLTPPFLNFEVITPSPIAMCSGSLIDYRLSLYGVRFNWRTEIVDYDENGAFVDRQVKGPYKLWEHTHTFTQVDGGTLMKDLVKYEIPFGFLGSLAHPLFVRRSLEQIFDYRWKVSSDIFDP